MAFRDFPEAEQGVQLLQRSLERGRLGHAYLFTGSSLEELERVARSLAKTLNCVQPATRGGLAVDCCDACLACRKIEHDNHADVFWVRPESKSRQIRISQFVQRDESPPRVLLDFLNLKPTESRYKVAVIVAADRMNEQAANSFLKTLEEPPAQSVLVLLSCEPQRLLETILSRCLRLHFGSGDMPRPAPDQIEWLTRFGETAAGAQTSLIDRYRLLDLLLGQLADLKTTIEQALIARSPLERYPDADESLREMWEGQHKAAVESEYRRQRTDLVALVHWWLRDVWVRSLAPERTQLLVLPEAAGTQAVARRITPDQARANLEIVDELQRWLGSNVQEALALEVSLLKLRL